MKLKDILKNPPTKKIKCSRCNGSGIINRRGMISSDSCPDCHKENGSYSGTNTGKVEVQDFDKTEELIKNLFKKVRKKC